MNPTIASAVAVASTGVYFAGLAVLKSAAYHLEPQHGTAPIRLALAMVGHRRCRLGMAVLICGIGLQYVALSALTLPRAQPLLISALPVLIALGFVGFGEKPRRREWLGIALIIGAAPAIERMAAGTADQAAPALAASLEVGLPSVAVPTLGFLLWELPRTGTHARPLNGIAYGVTSGVLTGTAELAIKELTGQPITTVWRSPGLYLLLCSGALAIGQLQIALQRCRLIAVALTATITAKTYLLLAAVMLYQPSWAHAPAAIGLTVSATIIGLLALFLLPRHDRCPHPPSHRTALDDRSG